MNALQTTSERFAALRQKVEEPVIETWVPSQVGDTLIGEIVGSRTTTGAFGPQKQVTVRAESGEIVGVWLSHWLISQLQTQGASAGDLIALRYEGFKTVTTGNPVSRLQFDR